MIKFTASYKHYKIDVEDSGSVLVYDNGALRDNTKKAVLEIAEQVGYHSESAFYKVFFKQYEMTPQQYRREQEERGK